MADDDREPEIEVVRTDDGEWSVVRDGHELARHPNEAGAEAQRRRLAQAEHDPDQEIGDDRDRPFDADDEPVTDNIGG